MIASITNMGISIEGHSNVLVYVANNSDLNKFRNDDSEEYIHYIQDKNLIIKKSKKTKSCDASRSYSGCGECIRNLVKYSRDKCIEFFMIPIECDGVVISNENTVKTEEYLEKIFIMLNDEDQTELRNKYGLSGWDVEFISQLYKVFKLCNNRGLIVFC